MLAKAHDAGDLCKARAVGQTLSHLLRLCLKTAERTLERQRCANLALSQTELASREPGYVETEEIRHKYRRQFISGMFSRLEQLGESYHFYSLPSTTKVEALIGKRVIEDNIPVKKHSALVPCELDVYHREML